MRNKKGFSLISFLVYLALFSIIMLFSCHLIVSLIIPSFASMRTTQSIIAWHIATDLFVRDIRELDIKTVIWKYTSPDEIIWNKGDLDIGWHCNNNCLERIEGIYNNHIWTQKISSIVATGISKAIFSYEKKDTILYGIELSLLPIKDGQKSVNCFVAIRQKTL